MKKYSEIRETKEFMEASVNKTFKSVQKGFPEGAHNVVIVGQDKDFEFQRDNKPQSIGMVQVLILPPDAATLENDTPCELNRCVQASLASAIGCYTDEEWKDAAEKATVFSIEAHRMPPATKEEFERGKGKMKFTRRG